MYSPRTEKFINWPLYLMKCILNQFFQEVGNSIESFSEGRLKRFEFYANFAKLKRRLRSFRLKRFEVYANFARLSTLMSVKFVAAKHSSQTLRGVR